jgi:hypothetical protein
MLGGVRPDRNLKTGVVVMAREEVLGEREKEGGGSPIVGGVASACEIEGDQVNGPPTEPTALLPEWEENGMNSL